MKKIIGILCLAGFFVAMISVSALLIGWIESICAWLISLGITALAVIGVLCVHDIIFKD